MENIMKKLSLIILSLVISLSNANALDRYTIADLVDSIQPSVVNIKAEESIKEQGDNYKNNPFSKESKKSALDNLHKASKKIKSKSQFNIGSGVIISADGFVITNYHVVELSDKITVTMTDNKFYPANIVGFDQKSDLALLKIQSDKVDFPVVNFADSNTARVGEMVIAIGNPYGLDGTVSTGIVSGRNRNIGTNIYDDFLQTDASINPGNSGGPLFNLDGDIVGINTAIFSKAGGSNGIGFAIPANTVQLIIQQLKDFGKVTRGWLGIQAQVLDQSAASALKLETTNGVLVADVTKGSPADLAKIQNGDVILAYNQTEITSLFDLPKMVAKTLINSQAVITVLRAGEKIDLTATIVSTDDAEKVEAEEGVKVLANKFLGFAITNLTDEIKKELLIREESGVIITNVDKSFRKFNVKTGDLIVQVDQQKVQTVEDFRQIIEGTTKKTLLLFIKRAGDSVFSVIER
ncbi:MAG TPA: peptidase [Alphaproteobacteria bacterium]|nr:peptidase [Alphaproteobacteria bacterium]